MNDDVLAGVCAGIAYSLGIRTWIVRVLWLCSLIYYGIGGGLYIILWIAVPRWEDDPPDYHKKSG